MLAYCSVAADREFWSKHWGGRTLEELLAVARTSPLTDLIVGALPPTGVVREAGCGLGQYVRLLRARLEGHGRRLEHRRAGHRAPGVGHAAGDDGADGAGPAFGCGHQLRVAWRRRA